MSLPYRQNMTRGVIFGQEIVGMRSQRLIACLQLLQGERRLTARYLSEQLDVSMRTVYRDVEALCEAGVPIHMERGPLGGIVLADGYRRALAQFTNEELQSLFAAGSGPLTDLGLSSHGEALSKLAGALPTQQRQTAKTTRERLLLDHNRWSRGEQPTKLLVELRRAIDDQHSVRLEYRDRAGSVTSRLVDPLGLVSKAGVWYMIAREAEKGYRTFRVQRIIAGERLARSFTRPPDFDLESFWSSSVATIERRPDTGYPAVVRVRSDMLAMVRSFWSSSISAHDADGAIVQVVFPTRDAAVSEIVPFGHVIEIVSPPDLVDALIARAEAIAQKHRDARDARDAH